MSKILSHIKAKYSVGDWFDSREISQELNIDTKVCAMVLQKMYNKGQLGGQIRPSAQETYYWLEIENQKIKDIQQ